MTAFYADYIANLRALFSELDRRAERFQTFDVRLELVAGGSLFVYETKRRKGQTDRIYYGRSATGASHQISQASAFLAIDRFFSLGQFLALTRVTNGRSGSSVIDTRYPHCAVNFSYRKKGQPVARSMLMVFMGFNDLADAQQYAETTEPSVLVAERPHYTERCYEWK